MKKSIVFSVLEMLWIMSSPTYGYGGLKVGYYSHRCPQAESIISRTVLQALRKDPTLAAAIIRIHFHDCFVRGCDGSILIDSTPGNRSEKEAPPNLSLRGFAVFDEAKRILESVCPQVVSCADIIAFAARDSSYEAGKISWHVPAGRKDGMISKEDEINRNLPSPFNNIQQMTDLFEQKGLSQEDVVVLSGAHSIGVTRCIAIHFRLYNFNNTGVADPSLDPQLAKQLKLKCPLSTSLNSTAPLESITPSKLDNLYYSELLRNRGVLTSDQTLITNSDTRKVVEISSRFPTIWRNKFANAMVRMGAIDVLTGSQGEIRKNCRMVNRL